MLAAALLFPLLQITQQSSDSVVTRAKEAIKPLVDSVALRDAGFFPIGFGVGTRDLTPFQGQHWISLGRFANNGPTALARPTFMMYIPAGDSLVQIGVAYARRIPVDSAQPREIGGVSAEWHSHVVCRAIPGEGQVITDGAEDCKARGGQVPPNQITMVHVWTVPNPDGPYAHDNPALPYIANGLTPPAHANTDDRLFALALGEIYGAKLFAAHRIQRDALGNGKEKLDSARAPLRALAPDLRAADRAHDAAKMSALRKRALELWSTLASQYRAVALTDEVRAQFDAEIHEATSGMHHIH